MEKEDREEYEVQAVEEAEVVEAEPVEAEPVKKEILEGPPPFEEKKGFFSQFPKLFWVMNTMELFERGAYYGMMAILHVHVLKNLLFDPEIWGSLYAMLIVLLYFMPLVSGALALKYGFKKVLVGAFSILILGYFVLSTVQAGQLGILTLGLIFIGIGAGAFKPIISAAIAHVTVEKQRNLGYSIYYWMINLGAFAVPLTLGFIFPEELRHLYYWVFVISGALIIINTIIAFFFVTEPVEQQKDLSIKQAVMKIVPALKDKRFVILLAIYSGFWFMYAVNHTFLGPYMVDFKVMPGWFSLPFLAIVNPGTIIATGPFLGKMVEKYKSLNVMMVGMIIYVIGLMIAFFAKVPALFLTGIIIFSLGEFITHPGFIAYVSKISPKDKVTIYMACVFIPTGVGNAVAGVVQGVMWGSIVQSSQMPKLFGAIIAAVGALTIACLILYNRWINRMTKEEYPAYEEDKSIWVKLSSSAIAFMFIPILIGVGYVGGTDVYYGTEEEGVAESFDWEENYEQLEDQLNPISGYFAENSEGDETIPIDKKNIISITFSLSWVDEADDLGFNNQPDEFSLWVEAPNGTFKKDGPKSNNPGGEGQIVISFPFDPDEDPFEEGTGGYNITIICGDCGDQQSMGPLGFITRSDNGNNWELLIDFKYYQKKE
jgi:POT family proton-dependent oligopeptide transporter